MSQKPPTERQRKAIENIRNGMDAGKAMIAAGYDPHVAESPNQNLFQTKGGQMLLNEFKDAYNRYGITPDYLTRKQKEHLEATKVTKEGEQPDYQTQLKAAEIARRDINLWQENEQQAGNTTNNTYIFNEDMAESFAEYLKAKTEEITGTKPAPPHI